MYNPAQVLPGKSVGPSQRTNTSKASLTTSLQKTTADSLGIRVDTNVARNQRAPPQQVFPRPLAQPVVKGTSNIKNNSVPAGKRRNGPPLPLNLDTVPRNKYWHSELLPGPPSGEIPTPIIIVTPTQDENPGLHHEYRPGPSIKPRIASSIYTARPGDWSTKIETSRTFPSPEYPPGNYNPYSEKRGQLHKHGLVRSPSAASIVPPTPFRSNGWWNVVTSPFTNRFSGVSSSRSPNSSESTEHTPLREDAAPVGEISRDLGENNDADNLDNDDLRSSPFRYYVVPTTGEAAKYFDANYDFSTPNLLPAEFATPNIPQTARSANSDCLPFTPEDHDLPIMLAGETPQVLDSSRKVPPPQAPSRTPPKSSCAAVVENFAEGAMPAVRNRYIAATPPAEDVLSPEIISPTVQTAAVGTVQTARSINTEATRTPVPVSKFVGGIEKAQSKQATPEPAFRLVTDNKILDSDVATGNHESPRKYAPQARSSPKGELARPLPPPPLPPPPPFMVPRDNQSSHPSPYSASRHVDFLDNSSPSYAKGNLQASRHAKGPSLGSTNSSLSRDSGTYNEKVKTRIALPRRAKRQPRFNCNAERVFLIVISIVLLVVALLAITLCMTLTHDHSDIPVESHWLNLTGFPPLPTGISTVSLPKTLRDESGCVEPSEMWSCALPRGQQKASGGSLPNFRFSILFNNDTISDETRTQPLASRRALGGISPVARARALVHQTMLRARSALNDIMFTPSPAPPTDQDQEFLGRTTDNVQKPFVGEETPFVISLVPTTLPDGLGLSKRTATDSSNSVPSSSDIPAPSVEASGRAGVAYLYPFPEAQPLRLFDRGLTTEHYGFYTYYDKSVFLYSPGSDPSATSNGNVPAINSNGGALRAKANARCTWSQTRFLVQIWTNTGGALLPASPPAVPVGNLHLLRGPNGTASAFDFSRPGSFPWPVTISIDRHGGDPKAKGVYCYGVDSKGNIVKEQSEVHEEDRAFDGKLVNPAPGPFTEIGTDVLGIDGGTGGCSCQWANWQ